MILRSKDNTQRLRSPAELSKVKVQSSKVIGQRSKVEGERQKVRREGSKVEGHSLIKV